jgi:hypothetical protein
MDDLSQDFDVLAERADECGALWAARTLRRLSTSQSEVPRRWPGTIEEARRWVATFAARAGFAERERLATLVQHAAEWTWTEAIDTTPPIAFARTA